MNYKTTVTLVAALVCLLGIAYFARRNESAVSVADKSPPKESTTTRDFLETKLSDITKIVCKRRDQQPEWVFEKVAGSDSAAKANWKMVAPVETPVAGYEVDRIGNQLTRLQYDISFKPGEPGAVTAAQAGLEPAELTISLTDSTGASAVVEIGKPASDNETYVRQKGRDAIVLAKSNLKGLVKAKAMEYRDLQLWTIPPEKVTRIEIVDQSNPAAPVAYRFGREGPKWVMEAPVSGKATGKVDEMLRTVNRLRASKWEDDRPEKLPVYGLEHPAWTARVTVEEEVPVDKPAQAEKAPGSEVEAQNEEETKPETVKKSTVYTLHISERSPIGDETKTYIRVGDEALVGSIAKTVADKIKPVMAEWRDMHVTTANVNESTRVEVKLPEGHATLVKDLGRWKFEGQGDPAEDAAVKNLLKTIQDLTAVAFVEGEASDVQAMGFQQPQAEIRLTVPGVESVERLTVGGYTDAAAKRLVYVRRNDATSVAKVKASDVAPMLQSLRTYRDRTIFDVHPSRFEKLTVTTQPSGAADTGPLTSTIERVEGQWKLSAPVEAAVRTDRIEKLVTEIGTLRAEAIVADEGELTAFGLHAPSVRLQWTYKPPVEYRVETPSKESAADPKTQPAEDPSKATPAVPIEVQPPSQTLDLIATSHDGKYYAKRSDRPAIYQVSGDFYNSLRAELRAADILAFDETQVRRFSIRHEGQTFAFEKKDNRWIYISEPDLPLDPVKVQNLLLQIKDLKTERYVGPAPSDLSALGLAAPNREVTLVMDDGTESTLWIAAKLSDSWPEQGFFATIKGRPDVFLISPDMAQRFQVSLADLEKSK